MCKHEESVTGHFIPRYWARWELEVTEVVYVMTIGTGQQMINILITDLQENSVVRMDLNIHKSSYCTSKLATKSEGKIWRSKHI